MAAGVKGGASRVAVVVLGEHRGACLADRRGRGRWETGTVVVAMGATAAAGTVVVGREEETVAAVVMGAVAREATVMAAVAMGMAAREKVEVATVEAATVKAATAGAAMVHIPESGCMPEGQHRLHLCSLFFW